MLAETEERFRSYFANEPQVCSDGQIRSIDDCTRIDRREIDFLVSLIEGVQPDCSVETGLAYGFSTLAILDYMERKDRGRHIAIDPHQIRLWHGIALTSIRKAGLDHRFTWIQDKSYQALAKMIASKTRVQFIFCDGSHHFDGMIADFVLANEVLDVGGKIVFNQYWMPGGRAAASFIERNMLHYRRCATQSTQLFAFEKIAQDRRVWDHFIPFESAGGLAARESSPPRNLRSLFWK